jgi:hypothetical protein
MPRPLKYSSDLIEEVRHGHEPDSPYFGLSLKKIADRIEVPYETVRSWRKGIRGLRGNKPELRHAAYKNWESDELRTYVAVHGARLIRMYLLAEERIAAGGRFEPDEIEEELHGEADAQAQADGPDGEVAANKERGGVRYPVSVGRPTVREPDAAAGTGRPRPKNLLVDRG